MDTFLTLYGIAAMVCAAVLVGEDTHGDEEVTLADYGWAVLIGPVVVSLAFLMRMILTWKRGA